MPRPALPSRHHTMDEGEYVQYFEVDGLLVVVGRDSEVEGGITLHCHGPNDHFAADGSCEHTDKFLSVQKPDSAPCRVLPFRGWGTREAMEAGDA